MAEGIDPRVIDLLAARLCHDLIGPVAAVDNGVELVTEEGSDFDRDALALVGDSARRALRRLQFYRFAYGYSGGVSAGPAPCELAGEFFEGMAIACDYGPAVRVLPLEWQKLGCNLLAVGAEALPRGGRLVLAAAPSGLALEGVGEGGGPSPAACAALALTTAAADLTARTVGAYFAGVVARGLGCRISAASEPGRFRLSAARV